MIFGKLVRCEGLPFFICGWLRELVKFLGGLRPGPKLTGYLLMTFIHLLMLAMTTKAKMAETAKMTKTAKVAKIAKMAKTGKMVKTGKMAKRAETTDGQNGRDSRNWQDSQKGQKGKQ